MQPVALALIGGLDAVLHCQQGIIRRDQALAAGVAESSIDSLVARGRWSKVLPRTYSVGADLNNPIVRIRAGWLWAGEDSVVAGRAAALWHRLCETQPAVIDLVIPPSRRMSRQRGYAITRAAVHDLDRIEIDRVAVTSPASTCLQLARLGEQDHLETALRQRKVTQAELERSLALARISRGQRRARIARAAVADSPWSNPERAAHRLFRQAGIRGWTGNAPVVIEDGIRFPDVVFEKLRLLVEIDGHAHHSSRESFESDRRRQNQLVQAGWTVLRFTATQLATDPQGVIAAVGTMIARLERARRSPTEPPLTKTLLRSH